MRHLIGLLICLQVAVALLGAFCVDVDIANVATVETFALFNTAEAARTVVREIEVCGGKADYEAADDVAEVRSNEGPAALFSTGL